MRTSDPEKALAMLLPIIDKEKEYRARVYAAHVIEP